MVEASWTVLGVFWEARRAVLELENEPVEAGPPLVSSGVDELGPGEGQNAGLESLGGAYGGGNISHA